MTWSSIVTSTWWCSAQRPTKNSLESSASRRSSTRKSNKTDTRASNAGRKKSTSLRWTDCSFKFISDFTGRSQRRSWRRRSWFTWIPWAHRTKNAESSFSSIYELSMKVTLNHKFSSDLFFKSKKARNCPMTGPQSPGLTKCHSKTTAVTAESSPASSETIFPAASPSSTSQPKTCRPCEKQFWSKSLKNACSSKLQFSQFCVLILIYLHRLPFSFSFTAPHN